MKKLIAALAAPAMLAAPAFGDTMLGLTGDRTLVMIDPATATVTGMVDAQGVDRLLGIDLRPGNNTVIGVTNDMRIVTIDPASGETVELSQMDTPLPVADMQVVVEVNAVPDRLRLMTGTTNHRVNMDTGEVIVDGDLYFDDADANADAMPMVVATAYTNAYGQPEETAMYNIDTGLSALIRQTAPNDGTLATIGMLGVELDGPVALDVATTADGENTAWLAANGGIHIIDLETGAVAESWSLTGMDGELRDITVLPAM